MFGRKRHTTRLDELTADVERSEVEAERLRLRAEGIKARSEERRRQNHFSEAWASFITHGKHSPKW